MKKYVIINGSPRTGGNCDSASELVLNTLSAAGCNVENFRIRDMNVHYCTGCNTCKKTKECCYNDDATYLLSAIDESDGAVLISPIYFQNVPGPVKTLIDRFYVKFDPSAKRVAPAGNKKLGIVLSFNSGSADRYAIVADQTASCFATAGLAPHQTVLCGGNASRSGFANNEEQKAAVDELVKWLAE